MKIGFLLPAVYAIGNPFNGVREQAMAQAVALEALGHEVVRLDTWEKYDLASFDVIQFFFGGPAMFGIETRLEALPCKSVFAPIIDTMIPDWQYRIAERLGSVHPKVSTIQSVYREQGAYCDVVIARSEFERRMLVKGLGLDPSSIHIALNGCPPAVQADPGLCRQAFDIDGDFILHISRITNQSKNVENLIEAVGPTGHPLILAGTSVPGEVLDRIESAARRFENVRILGRVDDEQRNSLYAACRVFALPSVREGTGLVALEAASYGAAIVITANGGPPDYFLDLADYVQGSGVDEIRSAITQAWNRTNQHALQNHVAENLSWQKSAKALLAAYGHPETTL